MFRADPMIIPYKLLAAPALGLGLGTLQSLSCKLLEKCRLVPPEDYSKADQVVRKLQFPERKLQINKLMTTPMNIYY
jgi:hypothetical protein